MKALIMGTLPLMIDLLPWINLYINNKALLLYRLLSIHIKLCKMRVYPLCLKIITITKARREITAKMKLYRLKRRDLLLNKII